MDNQTNGLQFIGQDAPQLINDQSQGRPVAVGPLSRAGRLEKERITKQLVAIAAADAFALANPVVCLDCAGGNHARCVSVWPCGCCGERRAA